MQPYLQQERRKPK